MNKITKLGRKALIALEMMIIGVLPSFAETGKSSRPQEQVRFVILPFEAWQFRSIVEGARVDILATRKAPAKTGDKDLETYTLLQNVEVAKVFAPDSNKANGHLQLRLLRPDSETLLSAVAREETLDLIERGLADVETHPMMPASFDNLFRQ